MTVFRYLTIGTNDLDRAAAFYDAVLHALGLIRLATRDNEIGYGRQGDLDPIPLWIVRPWNEAPATVGNGTMAAFHAARRGDVDAFHELAVAHGGTDEGKPGLRPYGPGFYAAYVRDPDGNKLSAVCTDEG